LTRTEGLDGRKQKYRPHRQPRKKKTKRGQGVFVSKGFSFLVDNKNNFFFETRSRSGNILKPAQPSEALARAWAELAT